MANMILNLKEETNPNLNSNERHQMSSACIASRQLFPKLISSPDYETLVVSMLTALWIYTLTYRNFTLWQTLGMSVLTYSIFMATQLMDNASLQMFSWSF